MGQAVVEESFSNETSKGSRERLIEALLKQHLITPADVDRAMELQRQRGESLSRHLVDLGLVESKVLAATLSQVLQIPVISLSRIELDT